MSSLVSIEKKTKNKTVAHVSQEKNMATSVVIIQYQQSQTSAFGQESIHQRTFEFKEKQQVFALGFLQRLCEGKQTLDLDGIKMAKI